MMSQIYFQRDQQKKKNIEKIHTEEIKQIQ